MSSDTNSLHSTVASALLSFTKGLESAGYKILHHHFVLSSNHAPTSDPDTVTPIYYTKTKNYHIGDSSSIGEACSPSCAYNASQLPTVSLVDGQLSLTCKVDLKRSDTSESLCHRHGLPSQESPPVPDSISPPPYSASQPVKVVALTQQRRGAWLLHSFPPSQPQAGTAPTQPIKQPSLERPAVPGTESPQPGIPPPVAKPIDDSDEKDQPKVPTSPTGPSHPEKPSPDGSEDEDEIETAPIKISPKDLLDEMVSTPSSPATFDGSVHYRRGGIIDELMEWARDPNAPRFYWLHGSVGTGKTAISQTFKAELSDERCFAASFFCQQRRQIGYSQANKVIPVIANELAKISTPFKDGRLDAFKNLDGGIWSSIERQFYQLIVVPFKSIQPDISIGLSPAVFILDSLDECDYLGIEQLLFAFYTSYAVYNLPFKFFVTGRSNSALQYFFGGEDDLLHYLPFSLSTDEQDIDRHIYDYIASNLQVAKAERPSTEELKLLVAQSKGCFLYAVVLCRWIDTHTRLSQAVSWSEPGSNIDMDLEPIDALYCRILRDAFESRPDVQNDALRLLAFIVALSDCLPLATLAFFFGESPEAVYQHLLPFRSIIVVPQERSGLVLVFHGSFRTFLSDESRSGEFYLASICIDVHHLLTQKCMSILEDLEGKEGREAEGDHVRYALTSWVVHIVAADPPDHDGFHQRMEECLSIWMKRLPARKLWVHARDLLAKLVVWVDEKLKGKVQVAKLERELEDAINDVFKEKPPPSKPTEVLERLSVSRIRMRTKNFCADLRILVEEGALLDPSLSGDVYFHFKQSVGKTIPKFCPFDEELPSGLSPPKSDVEIAGKFIDIIQIKTVPQKHSRARDRNHEVICEYISETTRGWREPTNQCLDQIYTTLDRAVKGLAGKHFGEYERLKNELSRYVKAEVLDTCKARTKQRLVDGGPLTLETKPGRWLTINTHYLKQQEDQWREHYIDVYRQKASPSLLLGEDQKPKHYQELLLAASIRAHFQITFQRFIDYVPLTIEYDLGRAFNVAYDSELRDDVLIQRLTKTGVGSN